MLFIVRALFWIGVVLLLLPADASSKRSEAGVIPDREAGHALAVAASFCLAHPASCQRGIEAARQIGEALAKAPRWSPRSHRMQRPLRP
jgi:hypothetical protein